MKLDGRMFKLFQVMSTIDNLKFYLSAENQKIQLMSTNQLKEFTDFLIAHQKFNLIDNSYAKYPDTTSISVKQSKDLPKIETKILNCNGLEYESFVNNLEDFANEAIYFIQSIYASYQQGAEYFLKSEIKRLEKINSELINLISGSKSLLNTMIFIGNDSSKLTKRNITNTNYKFIKDCLKLQLITIEKILSEVKELNSISEYKPIQKVGFKSYDDK